MDTITLRPIGFVRSPHKDTASIRLLGRDGARLRVSGVDMLDGTPIVDIKPCLSGVPMDEVKRGWLEEAEKRKAKG